MVADPTRLSLGSGLQKIKSRRYRIGSVPLHWHDFYEIEVVTDGVGRHTVNGRTYEWRRGEMHLMRLVDFHEIELPEGGEVHLVQIKPALMPEEFLKAMQGEGKALLTYLSERELSYMDTLCSMLEEQEPYDPRLTEHILSVILTVFFGKLEVSPPSAADDSLLGRILLYIGERIRSELSLSELADRFFISKNYLCSYFKRKMGKTVLTYIKECRLGYGAKLLASTSLKSIEISEACGYGSLSNFLRDFKRMYGLSPMQYREKAREESKNS